MIIIVKNIFYSFKEEFIKLRNFFLESQKFFRKFARLLEDYKF